MVQAPILAIYDKALECEPLVKADENYFQSWKTEIPRPKTTFPDGGGLMPKNSVIIPKPPKINWGGKFA
jgi:hypothetical protein